MNNTYWPMAVALTDFGKPELLFTYNSVITIEEAYEVFKAWQNKHKYTILSYWINDENNNMIEHHVCFNSGGILTDIDGNIKRLNQKEKNVYLFCTKDNYNFCVKAYSQGEAENIAQTYYMKCEKNGTVTTSIYNGITFLKEVTEDYAKYNDLLII